MDMEARDSTLTRLMWEKIESVWDAKLLIMARKKLSSTFFSWYYSCPPSVHIYLLEDKKKYVASVIQSLPANSVSSPTPKTSQYELVTCLVRLKGHQKDQDYVFFGRTSTSMLRWLMIQRCIHLLQPLQCRNQSPRSLTTPLAQLS